MSATLATSFFPCDKSNGVKNYSMTKSKILLIYLISLSTLNGKKFLKFYNKTSFSCSISEKNVFNKME